MPELPREFPHLLIRGGARSERYISPGSGPRLTAPARDREEHARHLEGALSQAIAAGHQQIAVREQLPVGEPGFYLEFDLTATDLVAVEKLENRPQGLEVVAVRPPEIAGAPLRATVFVPDRSSAFYLRRVQKYRQENNARSGRPKNEALVTRLQDVRLAAVRSLFTDAEILFPDALVERAWWEVWLRKGKLGALRQAARRPGK